MNQLKFFKFSLIIIFLTFNLAFSQKNNLQVSKNTNLSSMIYYVDVKGVATKTICKNIEDKISLKKGVISFKTVGFPSKYFVLKASNSISEAELKSWLLENNLQLAYFGQGKNSLEALTKNKRANN